MFSGPVAFDCDDEYLLVDNVDDGMDLYSFPNSIWLRHFPTGDRLVRFGMQVAFGEQSAIAVTGSDTGKVRVFRLADGKEICSLRHKTRGMVQCVQVSRGSSPYRIVVLTRFAYTSDPSLRDECVYRGRRFRSWRPWNHFRLAPSHRATSCTEHLEVHTTFRGRRLFLRVWYTRTYPFCSLSVCIAKPYPGETLSDTLASKCSL